MSESPYIPTERKIITCPACHGNKRFTAQDGSWIDCVVCDGNGQIMDNVAVEKEPVNWRRG